MVYKIVWSDLAIKTYISNIEYLETGWTDKEVANFIRAVKRRIQLLSASPYVGRLTNKRKNVRKSVIHRRVILYYRVRSRDRQIDLLRFWATSQSPGRKKG